MVWYMVSPFGPGQTPKTNCTTVGGCTTKATRRVTALACRDVPRINRLLLLFTALLRASYFSWSAEKQLGRAPESKVKSSTPTVRTANNPLLDVFFLFSFFFSFDQLAYCSTAAIDECVKFV